MASATEEMGAARARVEELAVTHGADAGELWERLHAIIEGIPQGQKTFAGALAALEAELGAP